ncbi:ATPase RavA stimulator ViaA [Leminorella grimontii]|uniref:ATPase RavA stimulator ViaA n=1 Tax=Leminorella grimontii TaxID=82981 RepID=UPI00207DBBB2|nr:ATPase RavA stimulator ViaA [Leminorella grimontii]GKX61121.1 protein ViaA [Leminorella grimontii]
MSLQTIELLLSISETELIEEMIIGLLAAPQLALFFEKYPKIKRSFDKEVAAWKKKQRYQLQQSDVPSPISREFAFYKQAIAWSSADFASEVKTIVERLESLNSSFSNSAKALLNSTERHGEGFQKLFIERWRKSLSLQVTSLHVSLLETEWEKLMEELQERLEVSSKLEPLLVENDKGAGSLWDMSRQQKYKADCEKLIEYGNFLVKQPELRQLAEMLGRSYKPAVISRHESQKEEYKIMVREPAVLPDSLEGIHQSDDIVRMLPTEMVLLNVDELETEFYRRFLEQRLLTYRLKGDIWRERTKVRSVSKTVSERQPGGPFIVCVDTSGSMGGFNEKCAKAFCLALLRIAMTEGRKCHVMLFSTGVIHYELTSGTGISETVRFLSQRFKGGTDLAGCLLQTLEKIEEKEWQDADIVVISDFIAQRLPENLALRLIEKQKKSGHRFHAVAMSKHGKPGVMKTFDRIWRFETELGQRLKRRLFSR